MPWSQPGGRYGSREVFFALGDAIVVSFKFGVVDVRHEGLLMF